MGNYITDKKEITDFTNLINKSKVLILYSQENQITFMIDLSIDIDKLHTICNVIFQSLRKSFETDISLDSISNFDLNYFKLLNADLEIPTSIDFWKENCVHFDYNVILEVFITKVLGSFCIPVSNEILDF